MDVWKLTKSSEEQAKKIDFLIERIEELQACINTFIEERNEAIHSKKSDTPSVRAKRSTAAKS